MLQISSKKFFGDGHIEEKEFDSIYYSNFSWIAPITTKAGELRPSEFTSQGISSFVFRYTMRYEKAPDDILIMPMGPDAADQFRLLAGLWLNVFFHADHDHVQSLCRRNEQLGKAERGFPAPLACGFFNSQVFGVAGVVDGLSPFIDRVLGMPRKAYRLLISCLRTFFSALEAIDTNRDLAYSMFVYVLEGLTQGSDNFVPTWADTPDQIREGLEELFEKIQPEQVSAIKGVLLKSPHLKLMKRFTAFTTDHIAESFFTTEALGRNPALRRSTLHRALENLYQTRSSYVHALEPIHQHLVTPGWTAAADVFHWDNEPYLTFSGLVRLVRHVLLQFISRQDQLEKEDYPEWRSEIPGVVSAHFAPSLWINRAGNFHPASAMRRFNGLMQCFAEFIATKEPKVPDMSAVMEKIEEHLSQAKRPDKLAMIGMYVLFNAMLSDDKKRPNYEKVLKPHSALLDECSIELLAVKAVLGSGIAWPVTACEDAFENYQKRRHKANALNLPLLVEIVIMSLFANEHHEAKNSERFTFWAKRAMLDAAGNPLQSYLQQCLANSSQISIGRLLGWKEPTLETTATPQPATETAATPDPIPLPTATPEVVAKPEPAPEVAAKPEPAPEAAATPEPEPDKAAATPDSVSKEKPS